MSRGLMEPSGMTQGRFLMECTPRMAASGRWMMGKLKVAPTEPMLVMVKVDPVTSSGARRPSRAFWESSAISWASSKTLFRSASRTTGTMRPLSVATARPMW